ncbi:MAG: hypothetical protein KAR79_02645, partial [Simkaniaceae bacterium]|nr:hypothetical protein [Simkaniaceae bacterium]
MATGIPGIDTILDVANWTAENSTGIAKLAGISALNYFCPLAAVATATGISIYDNFPAISDWTRDIPNTATTDFEENLNTLLAVDQTSGAVNIAAEETVIAVMSALEGFVEFPLLLTGSTEWTNTEHRNQFQTTLAALRTLEARDIIPQNLRQQLNALRVVVQTYRHNQAGAIWRITDRVTVNSSVEIRRLSIALSSLTPGEHDRANVQQIVTMLRNHTVVTSERQSTYFNELVSALETLQQTPEGRVTITPPLRTFIGQSNVVFEEITRSQTSTRERIVDLAASRLPESVQSLVRTPQVAPPLLLRVYERLQHPVQEGDIQEIFRELRRAYPGITLAVPEDPTRANVIPCITAALQVRQQGDAYQLVIANREDLALPNSALSQLPESWQIEILQGQSNSQAVTETSWSPGALVERAQRELLSEPTPASGRLLEAYDQLLAVDQHTQTMLAASPAVVRELVQQLRTYAAYPLQLLRQGHWQNPEVPGRMNELANALDGILDGDQSIFLSEDIRNELSQARAALIEIRSRQNGRLRQVFEHRTNVSAVIEQRQGFLRDFLDLQSFSRETLEAAIAHFREVPEIFSEDTQHYQMIVRELESLNADSPILLPQALRGLLESTKFIYEQIEITQQDVFTRVTEFLPEAFRPGSQTPQEAVHPLIQVFVALEREEQLTAESYALLLGLLDTVNPDLRSILPEELPQNAEVRNAITQHLAERGQHPEQPDRQAIPGSTLASMPEPWQRAVIETPRRLEAVATSIPSVLGTISTAATAYLSGSGAAPADSPGALAIVTSLVSGTEGTILERITQALSTLPAHIQTGTYQVILSGLKLALESERLTTWITGQSRLTEEQQEALEADIRDAITLLTQIQENPIDTARHLPQHVLTGLGITNAEQDITTDTRAIELATNYIRNQFSTYVVHSNGMAIPGLNATTAPPRNLTEMHSEMTRDLDRLTPTESIPLDSAQLDQELNVQKEAFIKNSTPFAAF